MLNDVERIMDEPNVLLTTFASKLMLCPMERLLKQSYVLGSHPHSPQSLGGSGPAPSIAAFSEVAGKVSRPP